MESKTKENEISIALKIRRVLSTGNVNTFLYVYYKKKIGSEMIWN